MSKDRDASQTPLISVVMPVYEPHPEFFRAAVESVLAQSVADWELIIVEDPSDRSGAEMLCGIEDWRIRHLVNAWRTGQASQRNRTLAEARGAFIAFMDADDIALPFRLAKQLHFLRCHPDVDVLGSQVGVIDAYDRVVGYRWFPALHEEIVEAMRRFVPLCQPSVMLRRQVFESFGGFASAGFSCALEYEYWTRLFRSGVRFANFPEPLLLYRIHAAQIKQSRLRDAIACVLRIKELYWSEHPKWSERFQMWGERLLLRLPRCVVIPLVLRMRWHYRPPRRVVAAARADAVRPARYDRLRDLGTLPAGRSSMGFTNQ